MKQPNAFHLKYLIMLAGLSVVVWVVYSFWWNYATQMNPALEMKRQMHREFMGKHFADVLPITLLPGDIHLLKDSKDEAVELWKMLSMDDLYAVNVFDSTMSFRLNSTPNRSVIGIIGALGPDHKIDYDSASNQVIEYDPTNGLSSSGDVIYLFDK